MISTAGVARNKAGEFFIGKRKASENLNSCWEFPGGKADGGEGPEEALKREFREEFGVEIEVGPLLCTGEFSSKSDDYTLQVYRIKILGTPECREHVEIGWKSFKEIQELTFAPSDRIIINALGKSV